MMSVLKRSKQMTLYIVTVADKFQAAGEYASKIEIEAQNKKEAISKARKITRDALLPKWRAAWSKR